MDPEPLFPRRCEQIAELMQSRDEIDLLDVAGLLRQVIMDKHSLLDTANKNRIKPKFHVGVSRYADNDPYEKSTFLKFRQYKFQLLCLFLHLLLYSLRLLYPFFLQLITLAQLF